MTAIQDIPLFRGLSPEEIKEVEGHLHEKSFAKAEAPTTVWYLLKDVFAGLLEAHPRLSHSLNEVLAHKIRSLGDLVEEVTLMDSQKRLVKFLNVLFIPFTREEIEEEDIGISLFTTHYQDQEELKFFQNHDRERVMQILQCLCEDSQRHKERAHARLADELIHICRRSHPETSVL